MNVGVYPHFIPSPLWNGALELTDLTAPKPAPASHSGAGPTSDSSSVLSLPTSIRKQLTDCGNWLRGRFETKEAGERSIPNQTEPPLNLPVDSLHRQLAELKYAAIPELNSRASFVAAQWQIHGPGLWAELQRLFPDARTQCTPPCALVIVPHLFVRSIEVGPREVLIPGMMYDRSTWIPEWIVNTIAVAATCFENAPGSAASASAQVNGTAAITPNASRQVIALLSVLRLASDREYLSFDRLTLQETIQLLGWNNLERVDETTFNCFQQDPLDTVVKDWEFKVH